MDWKDKTVSMGLVDRDEFDVKLATVAVSERRIVVDPHDVEDWERIFRELGEGTVLEEVRWEEVTDISKTIKDLYYPHINIRFEREEGDEAGFGNERERRIFFTQDELPELEKCLKSIRKHWQQWQQYNVTDDDRFPDQVDSDVEEEVELEDALAAQSEAADEPETGDEDDDTPTAQGQEEVAQEDVDAEQSEREASTSDEEDQDAEQDNGQDEEQDDSADEDDGDIDAVVDRFMEE